MRPAGSDNRCGTMGYRRQINQGNQGFMHVSKQG